MHGFIFSGVFEIEPYIFLRIMFAFLVLLALLFAFIITYTFFKRNAERNEKLWQEKIAELISTVIFLNEGETLSPIEIESVKKQLRKPGFRQDIIDELIHAKKNLSGSFTTNLVKLYEFLELNKDSFKKLLHEKWHIRAKGLQELALMGQIKYVKQIFRLTNNENDFVRNEAQSALVSFYGFPGLRFLNITTYPISEWQQILFLNKLNGVKPKDLSAISKWLQSSNESVVIFALKLATNFNCYQFYDAVIHCLEHESPQVKLNALEYLKKWPGEKVPERLISNYAAEDKTLKLLILDILKDNGSEKELNFLLKQLHNADDGIKAAAAKTISSLHPDGATFLQSHLFADEYPWKAIFLQISNDRAA
jgi:hypothetical protein